MGYVEECVLCRIAAGKAPAVLVHEGENALAVMDLFPASTGHVLVLPKGHFEDVFSLPEDIGAEIMKIAISVSAAIRSSLSPAGLNLIQANGRIAGQTILHFHLHVVPRYPDDGIIVKFGHGTKAADEADLRRTAAAIRDAM